ncbi:MAG TPA: L,D-transpeptidase [Terriglobales bacterium]|nr:L,D-transpeptidase [Terriglobales bacterium]
MERTDGKSKAGKLSGHLPLTLVLAVAASALGQNAQNTKSVPTSHRPRRHVLVSIPDRKLAVLEDGKVIHTFPVAVGAAVSPSPTGEFQIVSRVANPTYYHPGVVIPPGSDNPVGLRWVGLNQKGYGIHGTNEPRSIGKAASHGCLRMRNRDIERFFRMVSVGDTVEIRGERDQQVAQIFDGVAQTSVAAIADASAGTMTPAGGGQ